MTNNFLFLITHLCSGFEHFVPALNANPRIQIIGKGYRYNNLLDIHPIMRTPHKYPNKSLAIHGDYIVFNYSMQDKPFLDNCKFVYLVREPEGALSDLMTLNWYTLKTAYNYYTFRLRRMAEMSKRTPNAILLTWDGLLENKGLSEVKSYLGLKSPIELQNQFFTKNENLAVLPHDLLVKARDTYERYLYILRSRLVTGG